MSYSALYIKKGQKTLKILGVVACVSFFIGIIFFVRQIGRQNGWQKTSGIDKLYVVNRSPHGFEVVWSTKNPVKEDQWVEVGTRKETYTIMSTFETIGNVNHAVVTDLKPDTTYYFRIRVGTKTYTLPSLVVQTIHTPKEVKEKPVSPAYGKVMLPSTRPYGNGVLIYEIDGYYPLAVTTKETGEWLIPLTGLVERKSDTISSVKDSTQVLIKLFSYPEGNIRTTVGQTRPLKQAMTAGTSLHIAKTSQKTDESVVLGTSTQNAPQVPSEISTIVYPKENAIIPGNTPLIKGTGPIASNVNVLIQGPTKQYSYRAKANETGNWLIENPIVLEPGRYTIHVSINNDGGTPILLRRTFNIIKSGEQVLGVATGTPTLVPTMPQVVPTYSSPTIVPTNTLSPTTAILPTRFIPTATPPVTGGGMSGFLLGSLFCIIIGAGLVIAF